MATGYFEARVEVRSTLSGATELAISTEGRVFATVALPADPTADQIAAATAQAARFYGFRS